MTKDITKVKVTVSAWKLGTMGTLLRFAVKASEGDTLSLMHLEQMGITWQNSIVNIANELSRLSIGEENGKVADCARSDSSS